MSDGTVKSMRASARPMAANDSASLWDFGGGVACFEVHRKMNTLDVQALEVLEFAISQRATRLAGWSSATTIRAPFRRGRTLHITTAWYRQGIGQPWPPTSRKAKVCVRRCLPYPCRSWQQSTASRLEVDARSCSIPTQWSRMRACGQAFPRSRWAHPGLGRLHPAAFAMRRATWAGKGACACPGRAAGRGDRDVSPGVRRDGAVAARHADSR